MNSIIDYDGYYIISAIGNKGIDINKQVLYHYYCATVNRSGYKYLT